MESLLFSPLIWLGALAAGLILSLVLFATSNMELRRLSRCLSVEQGARSEAAAAWRREIEALRLELSKLQADPAPEPVTPGVRLNISRRNQVLRLHRNGQTVEQIACALGLPKNEVALFLKLHYVVLENC